MQQAIVCVLHPRVSWMFRARYKTTGANTQDQSNCHTMEGHLECRMSVSFPAVRFSRAWQQRRKDQVPPLPLPPDGLLRVYLPRIAGDFGARNTK